jgi:hypothetical protein
MKSTVADYRYRVLCLRIVPVTGSPIYLTDHPRDLVDERPHLPLDRGL